MREPARAIVRAEPFRYDALAAELAGILKDSRAFNDVMRVEDNPGM